MYIGQPDPDAVSRKEGQIVRRHGRHFALKKAKRRRNSRTAPAPLMVQLAPAFSTRKGLWLPCIFRYLAVPRSLVKLLKVLNREEV